MKNWVLLLDNDYVGQIIFRKQTNEDGDFGLSISVYDEKNGYFAESFMGFGDNEILMHEKFDVLVKEEENKTIHSIAEELVIF